MYFQRHAYKQNFEAQQQKHTREHSESRPIQQVHFNSTVSHALLHHRQPMNEMHHLNNIPYTGLTNFQVYPTYVQVQPQQPTQNGEKEEPVKFRPPSSNVTYRPLIPPGVSTTPRSNNLKGQLANPAHSRERSTDENSDYFSNTIHDTSDTMSMKGKVVRKNGLKTVTKPNIPSSKNQSQQKEDNEVKQLRAQLDRAKAKSKNYDDVLRQKQSALEEVARLRKELQQRNKEKQSLELSASEWESKHRVSQQELAKAKHLIANYDSDVAKLTNKLQHSRTQNAVLSDQLTQMKSQLPDMLSRFERLQRLNSELQERIRNDQDEWLEEKSKLLEASTLSHYSQK